MLFNNLLGIYCFYCKKYYDPYLVILDFLYEESISCDKDHLIGNQSDPQWKSFIGE